MKPLLFLVAALSFASFAFGQQDKSKRPSPPAVAKETLSNGTTITIDYSRPSVRGRTIGKNLEPINGRVWRTGANEATVFEVNRAVRVEGKDLPAGKYALFTISGDNEWIIIFNKIWDQWGAFTYDEKYDALRVRVKPSKGEAFSEKMTFTISKKGKVSLKWGHLLVNFNVQ